MSEVKFFICEKCGKIIGVISSTAVPTMCCGEAMKPLVPGTVDASLEKHVPVVCVEGNIVKVKIGSVDHPMLEEHSILWVYLQTENGGQRKNLKVGGTPSVEFALAADDKPVAVYAYCNLHGLWKTEI